MYWPDTNSVVDVEPARKPVASAVRKYFTEGGAGVPPTVPGGDWFNAITNEVLNVLDAAGIDPSKTDDDQLLLAIQTLSIAGLTLEGTLEEEPSWEDVPAYKDGGPSGEMNEQAAALAARTELLRANSASDKIGILAGKMWAGEPVTIACYGDSTIDGNNTTGWIANPTDASGNAIGNSNHNLTSPNAWPIRLQNILREMNKNNTDIEVWNAGYSGKQIQNGWAVNNYQQAVIDNPYYGVPDITIVCFGWNDVGQPGSAINNYVSQYRILLQRIINDGTSPVLLTTDAAIMNGTSGNNRDNKEARRELDSALKSLATEFKIPIWDIGLAMKGWIQPTFRT